MAEQLMPEKAKYYYWIICKWAHRGFFSINFNLFC